MTPIRREDKEIIHNLSLLGMLFGAFVGGFLTVHTHSEANRRRQAEDQAAQTQSSLVRLTSNLNEHELSLAQAAIEEVPEQMFTEVGDDPPGRCFWVDLSQWGLWGICGAAILTGGAAGYLTLWGSGWLGAMLTYRLIRTVYRLIRKAAPDCPTAQRPVSPDHSDYPYQRNDGRLLPMLIKLFMLLTFTLGVIAVVVWQLTAI